MQEDRTMLTQQTEERLYTGQWRRFGEVLGKVTAMECLLLWEKAWMWTTLPTMGQSEPRISKAWPAECPGLPEVASTKHKKWWLWWSKVTERIQPWQFRTPALVPFTLGSGSSSPAPMPLVSEQLSLVAESRYLWSQIQSLFPVPKTWVAIWPSFSILLLQAHISQLRAVCHS